MSAPPTVPTAGPHYRSAAEIAELEERRHVHQFNDNAVRMTRTLSEDAGLQRIGAHLVRIEPGRDTTTHHWHDADEEFIYILSGRAMARIGDEEFEVGAGDFMGFPAPSPAHSMRNPFDEDLLYLVAGERQALDVVHYPDLKRTMIKYPDRKRYTQWDDLKDVNPR